MSFSDPIADMLTRIRNGYMSGKKSVVSPASKMRERVLNVLKNEGFIGDFSVFENASKHKMFEISLRYFDGSPVIKKIERISKPGRRVYSNIKALPKVNNGLGVSILSTSMGVMSDQDARAQNVGGEIICKVF